MKLISQTLIGLMILAAVAFVALQVFFNTATFFACLFGIIVVVWAITLSYEIGKSLWP